jgi:hypothetical protein
VIGHAVGIVGAEILHPQDADQKLRQLEHVRGQRGDLPDQIALAGLLRQARVVVSHHRHARTRRRHHSVARFGAEHAHEPPHERQSLVAIAGVGVDLPAAGLVKREHHLVPQALEYVHRRPPGVREQRVVYAGDEQRDARRSSS